MYELRENRRSGSHNLLGCTFAPVISPTIWARLGAGDLQLFLSSYDGFHKNRCSEIRTLCVVWVNFYPYFRVFSRFREISLQDIHKT
jgi:hypothetical protein